MCEGGGDVCFLMLHLDFQILDYFFPVTSLYKNNNMTWGLFLMDVYTTSNHLLGHCQLLCLFALVPATARGTLPVLFVFYLQFLTECIRKKIALLFLSKSILSICRRKNVDGDILCSYNLFISLVFS